MITGFESFCRNCKESPCVTDMASLVEFRLVRAPTIIYTAHDIIISPTYAASIITASLSAS